MDFEPAQGGWVACEGPGSELCRGDGSVRGEQGVVGGLDPKIGNAGHARTGSREVVLRGAVGLGTEMFLMVKPVFNTRADQLRQRDAQERGGLFQELSFAQIQLFEFGDFGSFEEVLRG